MLSTHNIYTTLWNCQIFRVICPLQTSIIFYSRYGYEEVLVLCFTYDDTFVDNIFTFTINTVSKYGYFVYFLLVFIWNSINIKVAPPTAKIYKSDQKFTFIYNIYGKVNLQTRFNKDRQMLLPDCFAWFSHRQAINYNFWL